MVRNPESCHHEGQHKFKEPMRVDDLSWCVSYDRVVRQLRLLKWLTLLTIYGVLIQLATETL